MYVLCIVAGVDYILKDAVSEISPLHMCWVNYKLEQKKCSQRAMGGNPPSLKKGSWSVMKISHQPAIL